MAIYGFGPFILDVRERRLTHDNRPVPLAGKPFDILTLLVEARGRLVEREVFNSRLWPEVTVEERNLTVQVSSLRKVLAGAAPAAEVIETVARMGYRLAVPVHVASEMTADHDDRRRLWEAESAQLQARTLLRQAERVPALRALGLFERALDRAPNEATAHAGLASTYLFLTSSTIRRPLPVDEAVRLARESAQRALALDGRSAEAYAVLGWLKMYACDWRGAEGTLSCGVELDPESVEAAVAWGRFLSAMGRHDAALGVLAGARRLDPLRRQTLEHLGLAHWMAGDADRALAVLADAVAVDPAARRPHFRRMIVFDQLGRPDEAMAERTAWLGLFGDAAFADRLAVLHRGSGYRVAMAEWIALLERLNQWFEAALQWMVLGEQARALEALERSVAEHGDQVPFLLQYPSLLPLHGDPRFERLVEGLRLEGSGDPGASHNRGRRPDNIAVLRPSLGEKR